MLDNKNMNYVGRRQCHGFAVSVAVRVLGSSGVALCIVAMINNLAVRCWSVSELGTPGVGRLVCYEVWDRAGRVSDNVILAMFIHL